MVIPVRHIMWFTRLVLTLALGHLCQLASASSLEDLPALTGFMDGLMAANMKDHHIPGATVSIVKDGKLLLSKGYGFSNLEMRDPVAASTTLFRIGSTSKLFTWTAVMQLVEQGKLDLNEDVNHYLSAFKIPEGFDKPITLNHIMSHSAGFEDVEAGVLLARSPQEFISLEQWLINNMPARVRPPGHTSAYSNWATALAGYIVERVSGEKFGDYVQNHILSPLGMSRTSFQEPIPVEITPHYATPYSYVGGRYVVGEFEYLNNFAPAGSMSSTANDMAKFMIAHLQLGRYRDVQILSAQTTQEMHQTHFRNVAEVAGFAHGFLESFRNGHRIISHAGGTIYFHTEMFLVPEQNFGLFVSTNAPGGTYLRKTIAQRFMDQYFPAELRPFASEGAIANQRLQKYVGTYRSNRSAYTSFEKVAQIGKELSIGLTADGTLSMGTSRGLIQFGEVSPGVFREINSNHKIVFRTDGSGQVTHLLLANTPYIAYERLQWHQSSATHFFVYGLLLLSFATSLWSAIRRQTVTDTELGSRVAIWIPVILLLLNIVFLYLLYSALNVSSFDWLSRPPKNLEFLLKLPLASIVLTAVAGVYAVIAWRSNWWSWLSRLNYSFAVLVGIAFIMSASYWNLIARS